MDIKLIQKLQEEDLFPSLSKKEVKSRETQREQERKRRRREILSGAKMTLPEALELLSDHDIYIHDVPAGTNYALMFPDDPTELSFYSTNDLIELAISMLKRTGRASREDGK